MIPQPVLCTDIVVEGGWVESHDLEQRYIRNFVVVM